MLLNWFKHKAAESLLLMCAAAILGFSSHANACVICVPYPTKTVADYLVESETVVLARENPNKPWSFIPIETLKGEASGSPIDNFLNSTTRRLLQTYPDRGVIFVLDATGSTKWRSLGFADEEYEKMVREVIRLAPDWQHPDLLNDSRLAYFAKYLGHVNRNLHQVAYLEIGRAPYSQIKQLGAKWPLDQIRALLRNPLYFEWHPLAILMLAHNGDASDRKYIIDKFASLARSGVTTNLSAWATAFIEIQEAAAVTEVEKQYFKSSERNREELAAVLTALSEHGSNGHTYLRDQIIQSYATLLDYHPEMASYVAKDLIDWRRWELSNRLTTILNNIKSTDPLTAYVIRLYLDKARDANTNW